MDLEEKLFEIFTEIARKSNYPYKNMICDSAYHLISDDHFIKSSITQKVIDQMI